MNYYISDMHWGEESVIEYDKRPFSNADECYRIMKERWNQIVTEDDHVYVVGDCIYEDEKNISQYLDGLNGHLHLIIGNNDVNLIKNPMIKHYFEEVNILQKIVDENGNIIVLCHYPIACWEDKNKENCIHIYGHVHKDGKEEYEFMNINGRAYNAGCMVNGYVPVTLEEIISNNKKHYERG